MSSNLPPGCNESDLPGCSHEDEAFEAWLENRRLPTGVPQLVGSENGTTSRRRDMIQGFIGIDPGAGGGLACIADGVVEAVKMPDGEGVWGWINDRASPMRTAMLEQVRGFIGGEGHPGSAMFNFGRQFGVCQEALTIAKLQFGMTFCEVPPEVWQAELGLPRKGRDQSQAEWKRFLKGEAQRLFPQVKVTLHTADAILICECCRRRHVAAEPAAVARPGVVRFGGV